MRKISALLFLVIVALTVVACADEASAPEEPEPSPPEQSQNPEPPDPVLAEGVEEVGRRTIVIAPSPGFPYNITPEEVETSGGELPPCDQLVFAFGWLVVDPPEPDPDFGLLWTFRSADRQSQEVGRGATGVAEVGCGTLTVENQTEQDISVALQYVIGEAP